MNFHVLTLFPEMIEQGLNTSILGRAMAAGYISLTATNIRDYAAPERTGPRGRLSLWRGRRYGDATRTD